MIERVEKVKLENGASYTGDAVLRGEYYIPNGVGISNFKDHIEFASYVNGVMEGFGYFHYGKTFEAGIVKNGKLNGWAIRNNQSTLEFGIYRNGKLMVNLIDLGLPIIDKIKEDCVWHQTSPVKLFRNPNELFLGIGQYGDGITKRFGFHFYESGDVYAGTTDFDCNRKLTGHFFHFDKECNKITLGYYNDGQLIKEIDKSSFINSKEDWYGTHDFYDFNIYRNFNPTYFDLFNNYDYHIDNIYRVDNGELMLRATPLVDSLVDNEQRFFLLPDNQSMTNEIGEANYTGCWHPNMQDYYVDFVNYLDIDDSLQVYRHKECERR